MKAFSKNNSFHISNSASATYCSPPTAASSLFPQGLSFSPLTRQGLGNKPALRMLSAEMITFAASGCFIYLFFILSPSNSLPLPVAEMAASFFRAHELIQIFWANRNSCPNLYLFSPSPNTDWKGTHFIIKQVLFRTFYSAGFFSSTLVILAEYFHFLNRLPSFVLPVDIHLENHVMF